MIRGVRERFSSPKMMADAVVNQANPVSTQLYTVLAETKHVRLISIMANVTWAANQPTLEVLVTIDGLTYIFGIAAPVSTTWYYAYIASGFAENAQLLSVTDQAAARPFIMEGQTVQVQVRYTGAAGTTNLYTRLKYAKY